MWPTLLSRYDKFNVFVVVVFVYSSFFLSFFFFFLNFNSFGFNEDHLKMECSCLSSLWYLALSITYLMIMQDKHTVAH